MFKIFCLSVFTYLLTGYTTGSLIKAEYREGSRVTDTVYRLPDAAGNLFATPDLSDRRYDRGGRTVEDPVHY